MNLSIVIPAFNEEERLPPMLEAYGAYFGERYGKDVELLVVVNGSADRTAEVARDIAARCPCVRVIEERERIGKGGAVLLGIREARGRKVGFVDADGSTPPAAFDALVPAVDGFGAAIASRYMRGSEVSPPPPLRRRFASRCFNAMVRVLLGLRLTDTQCGAKIFTRETLQRILPHLGETQWAFDVDMLFQVKRHGSAIREIPTEWHDVRGSKLKIARASANMFVAICRLRLLYSPFRGVVRWYGVLAPILTKLFPREPTGRAGAGEAR
jgi:glycosyltransferase involved in cell wall biosynthesis